MERGKILSVCTLQSLAKRQKKVRTRIDLLLCTRTIPAPKDDSGSLDWHAPRRHQAAQQARRCCIQHVWPNFPSWQSCVYRARSCESRAALCTCRLVYSVPGLSFAGDDMAVVPAGALTMKTAGVCMCPLTPTTIEQIAIGFRALDAFQCVRNTLKRTSSVLWILQHFEVIDSKKPGR